MSADPRVKIGCAALVWQSGRLLMMRRSDTASHGAGCWSVPGGWVDYGEDPSQAVLRELKEETGLIGRFPLFKGLVSNTYDDQDLHVVCAFYVVEIAHRNQSPVNMEPDKASDLEWVLPSNIEKKTPHFAPFASLLAKPSGPYLLGLED